MLEQLDWRRHRDGWRFSDDRRWLGHDGRRISDGRWQRGRHGDVVQCAELPQRLLHLDGHLPKPGDDGALWKWWRCMHGVPERPHLRERRV